jgi:hypothetical protein
MMVIPAAPGVRKGRPSASELIRRDRETVAKDARVLARTLRHIARHLEYLALTPQGDPRTLNAVGSLDTIARNVECRWAPEPAA